MMLRYLPEFFFLPLAPGPCRLHPNAGAALGTPHLSVPAGAPVFARSFLDRRLLDEIELRELLVQIAVAFILNRALVRLLAVLAGDLFDYFHTRDDLTERGEALGIEEGVVLEVDEDLRRAGVRAARREGDVSLFV